MQQEIHAIAYKTRARGTALGRRLRGTSRWPLEGDAAEPHAA